MNGEVRKPRTIRLTQGEYEEFSIAAEKAGMSLGDFLIHMVRTRQGADAFGAIFREQAAQHKSLDKLRMTMDFLFEFVSQVMVIQLMNQVPVDAKRFAEEWAVAETKMKGHLEKARRDALSSRPGLAALLVQEFLEEKSSHG